MYIYLHLWRKHMVFKWYTHLVLGCKRSFLYSSTFHQDLISYQTAFWSVFKGHLNLLVCIPDTPLHFPFISFSVTGHQLKERKGGVGGGGGIFQPSNLVRVRLLFWLCFMNGCYGNHGFKLPSFLNFSHFLFFFYQGNKISSWRWCYLWLYLETAQRYSFFAVIF